MTHDCLQQGWELPFPYVYLCSRCGECYVCRHASRWNWVKARWEWDCPDGRTRAVIMDGRLCGPDPYKGGR